MATEKPSKPQSPPRRTSERGVSAATAAAQRTVEEVRQLLAEAGDRESLAERAAEVHERLRSSLAAVEEAIAGIPEEAAKLSQGLEDELAEAERRIRENPLRAVLIAAGIGLLAGLLLRRR
jgi:ElaB/YqjD/DUF883 family membrane-anchored ribosome-binding protein